MKTKLTFTLGLLTSVLCLPALAQGTAFTYQGRLDDGANAANGIYDLRFTIYDSSDGAGDIAGPITNSPVAVSNGLFTVTLDFGPGVFTGSDRWLEIGVRSNLIGDFTTLTPRQALTATPYAITARNTTGPVDATQLTGTLPDARLSANVSLFGPSVQSGEIANGTIQPADLNLALFGTTFWKTDGNAGTTPGVNFLGTTDNQPLEIKVNGERGLQLTYATDGIYESINLVGGYGGNTIGDNTEGAVIAGGGTSGGPNIIGNDSDYSFIGGGVNNKIGTNTVLATIAGGTSHVIGVYADESVIVGGLQNSIGSFSFAATIAGGISNDIGTNALQSAISGGGDNEIGDGNSAAVISGGSQNIIGTNSDASSVGGGFGNRVGAESHYATIGGGFANKIASNAWHTTIAGGEDNSLGSASTYATIGGGSENMISTNSPYATIAGGEGNLIHGDSQYTSILGGLGNSVGSDSWHGTIAGGNRNSMGADSDFSTIGGGDRNTIADEARYATIPGGQDNRVATDAFFAFAAGRRAQADHTGSFVWGDSQDTNITSTASDQVTFRAQNGLRLTEDAGDAKSISIGDRYRDNALLAWGKVAANGTLFAAFGVSSVTNHSAGVYEIFLTDTAATIHSLIPMAIAEVDGAPASAAAARILSIDQNSSTASRFRVYINTGNYTLVNNDFVFLVTAR